MFLVLVYVIYVQYCKCFSKTFEIVKNRDHVDMAKILYRQAHRPCVPTLPRARDQVMFHESCELTLCKLRSSFVDTQLPVNRPTLANLLHGLLLLVITINNNYH